MQTVKIYRSVAAMERLNLFYMDTRTNGPAIVCLHGRWGRAQTWYGFMQHYGRKYRVIAPDQRGHGLSDKPVGQYTAQEMAEDVVALLQHLKLDSVILVGHSMGARVAGHVAALYPHCVRALALLDKSAAGPAPNPLSLDQIDPVDPLTRDWPLPFVSLAEAEEFLDKTMDSPWSRQYFKNSLTETVGGYRMMFSPQAMAANIAYDEGWFHRLADIRCPVMLVRAKGGEAVPDEDFQRMQALLPNCMSFEASNPDHNVHLTNPEEFYGFFDTFLRHAGVCKV